MYSTLLALVVVVLGITATLSAPLEKRQGKQRRGPETREEQIAYLRQFGNWRGPENDTKGTDDDLRRSLIAFQSSHGLKATGEFDDDTKELMATPRCGVSDDNEAFGRQKRYKVSGRKWPMTALTYLIDNYTPDLPTTVTKNEIIQAFKYWSDISPLTFMESTTSDANIRISFVSGDHGDGYPFDGKDRILAHAFYPERGSIHFDEDEKWTADLSGRSLRWIAIHEIGHALGLDHSTVPNSIMHAYYVRKDLDFTQHADDIEGIQSIYGKP